MVGAMGADGSRSGDPGGGPFRSAADRVWRVPETALFVVACSGVLWTTIALAVTRLIG
jgi:hypothetical protein